METGDNFDIIWDHLPHISIYQTILLCAGSSMAIIAGFWGLWVVFGLYTPGVRCINGLDEIENANFTWIEKRDFLAVSTDDQCSFYNATTAELSNCLNSINTTDCFSQFHIEENIVQCTSYSYDTSRVNPDMYSAVMEFNLVCNDAWIPQLITSMTAVGLFLGATLAGYISDTYGRKKVIIIAVLIGVVIEIGLAFTPNWWSFLILWICLHTTNNVAYIAMSVYIVEIIGPTKRRLAMVGSIMFGIGYSLISPIAYAIPNWRTLTWSLALMTLVFIPILFMMPMSPKWLHSNGRKKESIAILKRFAEKTNTHFSDEIEKILTKETHIKQKHRKSISEKFKELPICRVFRSPFFRIVAIVMGYTFVATTVLYYGISYNAAGLPGDLYVNNSISGIVEIAAYIVLMLSMGYIGRKPLTCGSIIFASIVCLIIGILLEFDDGSPAVQSAYQWLGFLGKFMISGTFGVIYVYAPELYPTEVRSTGLGLGSMAARIGGVAAPQIIPLQERYPWLPYTIFGIVTLTAGIAALWLPETFQQPIHQTLPEAEAFYKNQKSENDKTREISTSNL